jgi:hypothetical protein
VLPQERQITFTLSAKIITPLHDFILTPKLYTPAHHLVHSHPDINYFYPAVYPCGIRPDCSKYHEEKANSVFIAFWVG